jgi:hypothetical protein
VEPLIEALQSGPVLGGFALFGFVLMVGMLLRHRRRLDRSEGWMVLGSTTASFSIPRGFYLAAYIALPDPAGVHTRLHGYEKEICAAGLLLAYTAVATIAALCRTARESPPPRGRRRRRRRQKPAMQEAALGR